MRYEIASYEVECYEFPILKRVGFDSFMDELETDSKRSSHYHRIYRELYRVASMGLDWALESKAIKMLKQSHGGIPLYELRCLPGTTRVMIYLHSGKPSQLVVLLFDFKGHKASKSIGGIRKQDLEKGQRLAKIAKRLMEEKECGRHEEQELDS